MLCKTPVLSLLHLLCSPSGLQTALGEICVRFWHAVALQRLGRGGLAGTGARVLSVGV